MSLFFRMGGGGGASHQGRRSELLVSCTSLQNDDIIDNLPRQKNSTRLDSSLVLAPNSCSGVHEFNPWQGKNSVRY
jgi:hypothetical protein